MLTNRALVALVEQAMTALQHQGAVVASALAKQADAEMARVALDRERFTWERARQEAADAERRALREQTDGTDLPAPLTLEITRLAGGDAALKAQLVGFARQRLAREVGVDQVLGELRLGTNPKTL